MDVVLSRGSNGIDWNGASVVNAAGMIVGIVVAEHQEVDGTVLRLTPVSSIREMVR